MRRAWIALWFSFVLGGTLLIAEPVSSRETSLGGRGRLQEAVSLLLQTSAGRALVERATGFWRLPRPADLLRVLKWGGASKTDAVLTRHFNPKTGQEVRERQVTIYLRQDEATEDLVLDIAHELVHATTQPAWDPYDPKLTPGKYIWTAIEGEGGEVDAVVAECQVSVEVRSRNGDSARRCRGYLADNASGKIDREKVRRDFYRVGKWNSELEQRLGSETSLFPLLSKDAPKLYSSTGNAPYPVALLKEFEDITQIACQNTRKRVDAMVPPAGPATQNRQPAASSVTLEFLAQRCN